MERLLSQLREEIDQSGVTHRDIALSNLFYDTSLDKLVLVDHRSAGKVLGVCTQVKRAWVASSWEGRLKKQIFEKD